MKGFILIALTLCSGLGLAQEDGSKVTVAVIDSGVDFGHELLKPVQFFNPNETIDKKDDDTNGYVDDVSGWNLAKNDNQVFDPKDISSRKKKYDAAVTVMRLLARVEKGEKLSALEKAKMVALLAFIYSDLNNIGTIMHGTHVAGIITQKNPSVEILGVKMGFGDGKKEAPKLYMPTKEELEKFLAEMAKEEEAFFADLVRFLKTQRIRVANASWGSSEALIAQALTARYPKLPADAAAEIGRYYMQKIHDVYAAMPDQVKDTLFVIAAGNDGKDNDKTIFLPANVRRENTITVAAVDSKGALASFSNYGVENVDLAAEGVAVESSVPDNRYLPMSGTSMASPNVARVASMVVAENPALTPAEIRDILMKTVDKKDYLKRVVKSSGIVNEQRAVAAAKASRNHELDAAVAQAFEDVPATPGTGTIKAQSFKAMLGDFTSAEQELILAAYERLLRRY